jgi:hypothetical protein
MSAAFRSIFKDTFLVRRWWKVLGWLFLVNPYVFEIPKDKILDGKVKVG